MNTCKVDGCKRRHKAQGYCATHYAQFRRGAPVTKKIKTRNHTQYECCSEEGCTEPVKAKGVCATHYQRLLRHGHTMYRDRKKLAKFCSVPNCDNHLYANGICHSHYLKSRKWLEFGLTLDGYLSMAEEQGNVCLICKKPESAPDGRSAKTRDLSVDHSHVTNKVRGLLCNKCNRGLGLFCDDPSLLQSAMNYLWKHDDGASIPTENEAQ